MDILIDWDNLLLTADTYLLEMEATHEAEVWECQEEFVNEKTHAEQLNENAIELEKEFFMVVVHHRHKYTSFHYSIILY